MSIYYYLGQISKQDYKKLKNNYIKELEGDYCLEDDGEKYCSIAFLDIEQLYDFGKYIDFVYENFNKFINEKFYNKYLTDYFIYEISKQDLLNIIQHFHKKIANYYQNLYGIIDKDKLTDKEKISIKNHFYSFMTEWKNNYNITPYNLDLDEPNITDSWKYEYGIFELVRIYKTFDFKKNVLIFYSR